MENIQKDNSSKANTDKTTKHKWLTWLKRASYLVIAIYLLIWSSSPLIASYFLNDILQAKFKLELTERTSIRYNPFTSHLTIKELGIKGNTEISDNSSESDTVFELNRLDFEIRLHRLLVDELYISQFDVAGLSTSIIQSEASLVVAGINLNELQKGTEPAIDNTVESNSRGSEEATGLTIRMPLASLSNIKTAVHLPSGKHQFEINQWLLEKLQLNNEQQKVSSNFDAQINEAPLTLNLDSNLINQKGEVNVSLELKGFQLENIQGEVKEVLSMLKGQFDFSTEQKLMIDNNKLTIESPKTLIRMTDLELADKELELSLKSHQVDFSNFSLGVNYESGKASILQPLSIDSVNIALRELVTEIGDNRIQSQSQLVSLKAISVDQSLSSSIPEGYYVTTVDSVVYQPDLIRFESPTQLLTSEQFVVTLTDLQFEPSSNSIQEILVEGMDGIFKIKKSSQLVDNAATGSVQDKDKKLTNKHSNEKTIVAESSLDSEANVADVNSSPTIQINSVKLVDSGELEFIDESIRPKYVKDLILEVAEINSINSAMPEQESPFRMIGKSKQYTKIDFSGYLKPFTKTLNLSLKGTLSEFPLPPANSYIQGLLGFEIESGELDTKIDIEVIDSQIKGNTGIKIRGLGLAKAENHNQDVIQEQTAMPLNMALGMLKDSDDNVELDIPMLGDVDSPSFGIGSFVSLVTKKAIQSAAKSYLIKTFLPYADVISMTISAGEFILKTRFEDLVYQPAQVAISEQQQEFLSQFVALMKDKESTQVKVCGIAVKTDLNAVNEQGSESSDIKQDNDKLKELAKQRMEQFKNLVVEQGVESSRILLCSPKLDLSEGSLPRIEFSV